ncbi:adenylate/guanylate cyclase domain-containing protein [Chryseobacterium sp. GP-SGM7]|uniref:adenylate/guanylate cyclase domain-containing protein n=1 Tax=Chryseobacterium sp. GP-SGM7 TaxID=3411323 RepID=UPI003B943686
MQAKKTANDTCSIFLKNSFFQNNQEIELNKPWKFRIGDQKQWADKNFDDSEWEKSITKNFKNSKLQSKNPKDIVWLRTEICTDASAENQPIGLEFRSGAAMDVYWDGKFVKRLGTFAKDKVGEKKYVNPIIPVIISSGNAGRHSLAIRYENTEPFAEQRIKGFEITLSDPNQYVSQLLGQSLTRSFLLEGIAFIFFTLFLIHLLTFLFYRKDLSNLYFSMFNLWMSLFLFTWYFSFETSDVETSVRLGYISSLSGLFAAVFLSVMLNNLFGKIGIRFKILAGLAVLMLLLMIFFGVDLEIGQQLMVVIILAVSLEALYLIIRAIIKKIPGSRILGAGLLFFFVVLFCTLIYLIYSDGVLAVNPGSSFGEMFIFILYIMFIFSLPFTLSAFLAWRSANDNKNLHQKIEQVETLSSEKQEILETQNEFLECQVFERTKEINAEKKKSDDLLLNILPHEIAEELKQKGKSNAKHYDQVSVLFTDFVNFTANSEKIGVQEVLNELNICFTEFDRIMEKYNLEKIKTIGDAYLAVSGLPISNDEHAKNAVNAGLEILSYIQQRKRNSPNALDIRIGIHSGPVIAGIVGVKKFAYDIWGDTVNTAARMEQNSALGKLNISEATYNLIKDDFSFEYRGKIETKGKGAMEMYFVNKSKI